MNEDGQDPRNELVAALQLLLGDKDDEVRQYVITHAFPGSRFMRAGAAVRFERDLRGLAATAVLLTHNLD